MHILHCTYSMEVGGTETMLVDIMNAQVARGDRVTLLIVNDRESAQVIDTISPKVKIVRFHRREGSAPLLMMARLNMLIARLRPDIVHVHHEKFCRLVRLRRNRMIYTVHALNITMEYSAGVAMAAITDIVADDIRSRLPGAKVNTVPNGIIIADVIRRPDRKPQTFRLVQVGRLAPELKGQDIAIQALGLLKRRGIENIELTFIGTGAGLDSLRRLAEDENVAERVHFAGIRDRKYIYSHLCDFDAMIHSSRYEGFGLTVAEGMAAGLPLILTEHDGPWEVADNGRLCLSGKNGDAGSFADAIASLMADYPAALSRATEALDYVRRFDISHTVDAYDHYYRNILSSI